ncbi:hypothetical protein LEM8419_00130 [Neolewinella maritima]|uniref:LTD domain-containing protein n=1 Tax=Neolewinella maritima TaxID=1383882 RepID=A0ABN8F2V1_9BACT|nr:CotH kinase family protein [Neolewinella maritima]CAH0998800.1 hypothetical protein LEM8419_00130 [Neolewinella maritima]
MYTGLSIPSFSFRPGAVLLVLWLATATVYGQVYLNEASLANTSLPDEDGSFPDWFELYNVGPAPVDLTGWSVTDRADRPRKWVFQDGTLPAGGYLMLWASGKDRPTPSYPHALLTVGDAVRYVLPDSTVAASDWTGTTYDDTDWTGGATPLGYGSGELQTLLLRGTQTVFLRARFQVSDTAAIRGLVLDIDYDDAFVAYLNGVEIARAGLYGDRPDYQDRAARNAEPQFPQGRRPPSFPIADYAGLLREGDNVLAVQVHNRDTRSPDLYALPLLTAFLPTPAAAGFTPLPVLEYAERSRHTNFSLSSAGEQLYLYDAAGRLVNQLSCPPAPTGTSTGRPPNQLNATVFFATPTPGAANTTPAYLGTITDRVSFSRPGGPTTPFSLILSGAGPGREIRYTTDATTPTATSPRYEGPLAIEQTTVVRAAVFGSDRLPSATYSQTYLIGASHTLPTVSLVTDPDNLFSNERGIYVLGPGRHGDYPYFGANIWQDWERPVQFAFRDADGSGGTDLNAGLKIFGGWSRAQSQRSLSLFARGAYGDSAIDYPLFPDRPYEDYQSVVLRNSGNDWMNTMLRDAAIAGLYRNADLETLAYRPVATYLNGSYWGLYNLREKVNEHYLASRSGYPTDEINLLELGGDVVHGQRSGYDTLIDYVQNHTLEDPEHYQYVAGEVDVANFILYHVVQIYFNNTDWPANNNKFWRPDGGRWRWILFDTDFGFGLSTSTDYTNNSLYRALEAESSGWRGQYYASTLLRATLANENFRHQLINRFADEMNSRLLPERVHQHIDTLAAAIAPEMPQHFARWNKDFSTWTDRLDRMKDYATRRPAVMKRHLLDYFNLPAYHPLHLQNATPEGGYVRLNTLTITEGDWTGDYFEDVPVRLTAVARTGYTFRHWTGDVFSSDPVLVLNPNQALTVVPVFEAVAETKSMVVINEIHYASADAADSGDWIELYNPGSATLDLSDWEVKDNDDSHSFRLPTGSSLAPQGYLLIAQDVARFTTQYPSVSEVVGDLEFGLSGQGDAVRLYDAGGQLQDEVYYTDAAPWPTDFTGDDRTIALRHPTSDNALGQQWFAAGAGTPLLPNGNKAAGSRRPSDPSLSIALRPNPVLDRATVRIRMQEAGPVTIGIYNSSGQRLGTVISRSLPAGESFVPIDVRSLPLGMYILQVIASSDVGAVALRFLRQ